MLKVVDILKESCIIIGAGTHLTDVFGSKMHLVFMVKRKAFFDALQSAAGTLCKDDESDRRRQVKYDCICCSCF